MADEMLTRTYGGATRAAAESAFEADAYLLAEEGWALDSEIWSEGNSQPIDGIWASPDSMLAATIAAGITNAIMKKRWYAVAVSYRQSLHNGGEKECPRCAENVKARAQVCRFCNYEFANTDLPIGKDGPAEARLAVSQRFGQGKNHPNKQLAQPAGGETRSSSSKIDGWLVGCSWLVVLLFIITVVSSMLAGR